MSNRKNQVYYYETNQNAISVAYLTGFVSTPFFVEFVCGRGLVASSQKVPWISNEPDQVWKAKQALFLRLTDLNVANVWFVPNRGIIGNPAKHKKQKEDRKQSLIIPYRS